ncbi:condensation domain-containing protein [Streptomyces sp. NPDC017546]|uniref:condensation domain-containing protein n=1 Tax=Streptomyces sp. NPDC017546 TaxID=3365001 RepID=UPI003799CC03
MIPVSFGQHRLWLLDRFERTAWTYNVVVQAAIEGPLDVEALDAAVRDVLARHEALRTSFPEVDGAPRQLIAPADVEAGRLDVVDLPGGDVAALDENARYVFDLTREAPVRAVLFTVAEGRFVLQLVLHHIVVDGWSVRPLMHDLAQAYAARSTGARPSWEPLPVQFADFAVWQRDVLGSADDPSSLLSAQLDFWRSALAGLPAELPLPVDRERPSVPGHRGGAVPFSTDAVLHRRLRALGQECGGTLFMVVHAALAALLHRLGAGDDIAVGTVTAGRADESLNDLVGFFVNTLVLRTDVSGDPPFRELIARVRDFDLDAFDHQDAPFEDVVHIVRPPRLPGRHPLFQTILTIQSHEPAKPDFPGLSVTMQKSEAVELHSAKFDLYFDLSETWDADGEPAGIRGHLVHAADLWDERSAAAISQRLTLLLGALAEDPDAHLSGPDLLLDWERPFLTGESATERPHDDGIGDSDILLLDPSGAGGEANRPWWFARSHDGIAVVAGAGADPTRVADLVREHDAGALGLPTRTLATMLAQHPSLFDGLRRVTVAGELPPPGVLSALLEDHPRLRVRYVPEGAHARALRVLDATGRLAPLGVLGELHTLVDDGSPRPTGHRARRGADGPIDFPPRAGDDAVTGATASHGGLRKPRTAAEEVVCGIFADVLGVASVDVHGDFFDLGGQSLLAVRVVGRIRALFGIDLELGSVFRAPTPARLGALIRRSARGAGAAPRRVTPRPEHVPLSPAQLRLWMLDQIQGPSASYNVPIALRLRGDLDATALGHAIGDVVTRHEALRTIFPADEGEPFQYLLSPDEAHVELRRAGSSEPALPDLLTACYAHVFDLADGPLIRAHLIEIGAGDHVLLLVMHHIVFDGGSHEPFLRDLGAAYAARRAGRAPDRPANEPLQYADYALWQLATLGDAAGEDSLAARQLRHWRDTLAGLPHEVTLPPDRPRRGAYDSSGDTVAFTVPPDLHRGLADLARETGTTLFMVVHAGFAALLARLGAGSDIPVGTPVAGRVEEAFDDLVGFLTNTVVLRTDLSRDVPFRAFLRHVRDADLAAFGHQDVPFDLVVHELNPPRVVSRNPLFQVGFALEHHAPLAFAADGLAVEPVPMRGVTAKLDLDVTLTERLDDDGAPAGITGTVEFPVALYERTTIARAVDDYKVVLNAVLDDPDVRLSALGVVDADG